ncbi:MAG: hypothetical protein D8M59_08730 [Planctomycetes bacterium]|nr:hypothetical protein [Planctomycetota bacterium]NOG53917.1 hypothetical protein [Planctomycetota bacterium]
MTSATTETSESTPATGAPAQPVGPTLTTGYVQQSEPDLLVLSIPKSDYRLHLVPTCSIDAATGDRITGRVDAVARRIDLCYTGGTFIDPIYGRPRNIQGRIRDIQPGDNTLLVQAGIPMYVSVRAPQRAEQFQVGQVIHFAVDRGATFTPQS